MRQRIVVGLLFDIFLAAICQDPPNYLPSQCRANESGGLQKYQHADDPVKAGDSDGAGYRCHAYLIDELITGLITLACETPASRFKACIALAG